jgi:hypothetical protein
MSFGEVIPTTWHKGIYKLETDGTDSSGNGNTLPGLNTPNFTVARFGAGGMTGGTSGINRGLRHTTLNLSGGAACSSFQVTMWFKLNTTTITTNSCFYMINANGGSTRQYEMFGLGNISGGNLTIQNVLSTTTTPTIATVTVPADLNWHFLSFTADIGSGDGAPTGTHLVSLSYDGLPHSSNPSKTVSGPAGNAVSIGNHATSSTLQMWGTFDQVTINTTVVKRLNLFQIQNKQAQARGMFCI